MDIHRCRFVPYPASPINAVAFSHPSTAWRTGPPPPSSLRLAIGRASGDIEIWNPRNGTWTQETILRSGVDRSVEGLAWTHDLEDDDDSAGRLRLFSIGYSAAVTEWDLGRGCPIRHSSGGIGQTWCLTAQPRWRAEAKASEGDVKANQYLATGCADGSVILHSTADGDLTFLRTLPRPSNPKARALSLAFRSRTRLAAGYSDGVIRLFLTAGRGLLSGEMSLGASSGATAKGGATTLVWAVQAIDENTIASGDSTGEVKIWDTRTRAMLQRLQSHRTDVLTLAASPDGTMLVSGGIDRRTTWWQRSVRDGDRWIEVSHKRMHRNDVKAMAVYEGGNMSVIISGGVDATPILAPLRRFEDEHSRTLPSFPSSPPLESAPQRKLVMSWWDRNIIVWKVSSAIRLSDTFALDDGEGRSEIASIQIQGEESILSASLSANGRLIAVSTQSHCKLFALRRRRSQTGYKVLKIDAPKSLALSGAKLVRFSPDGEKLLMVRNDDSVHLYMFQQDATVKSGIRVMPEPIYLHRAPVQLAKARVQGGTHGAYLRNVVRAAWASDSETLVVGDLSGYLDVWYAVTPNAQASKEQESGSASEETSSNEASDVEGSDSPSIDKAERPLWAHAKIALPKLQSTPLILSFRPPTAHPRGSYTQQFNGSSFSGQPPHSTTTPSKTTDPGDDNSATDCLLVVTATHQVIEFRARTGRRTAWSRRNPPDRWPTEFQDIRDRAMGCLWDVAPERARVWLYGCAWLWMFDLSRDLPDPEGLPVEKNRTVHNGSIVVAAGKAERAIVRKRKREETGAGGLILSPMETGASVHRNIGDSKVVEDTSGYEDGDQGIPYPQDFDGDEEMMDVDESSELTRFRRRTADSFSNGIPSVADRRAARYWRTYKYRPILGIVPLSNESDQESTDSTAMLPQDAERRVGLEVALVERPLWEADLPPRWEGDQEWSGY